MRRKSRPIKHFLVPQPDCAGWASAANFMNSSKLRRQIAYHAARLMYTRQESEYFRAKQKAARHIVRGWVKPADLPSNAEIRDEILAMARLYEGDRQQENLKSMRLAALRMMRALKCFRPRLIGSVMTGHVRQGSDIDLHLFSDSIEAITLVLDDMMVPYDVERKRVRKDGQERIFTHIHVQECFPFELTIYASDLAHFVFKSSITGKAIERASIAELEIFLKKEYPDLVLEEEMTRLEETPDRFQLFYSLLLPLENVKQHTKYHPEADVLYHSLQVFDHARDHLPYDEEFLLAALLHDVGKGIDPQDHVAAGLEALEGCISERTSWLIEYHMEAHKILDGTIGSRARRRLQQNDSYEDLVLLCECDQAGRVAGAVAPELEGALDYIRELETMFGGG